MAVIKEVVVGGTSRSGHGCVPCGGGAPKACAVRGAQGVFYWLGVCGIIAGLGVGAWMRDDYYEYRRGDKWYRTIVFRDFEVKCEDIDGGDGRPRTLRDWIDFFQDPDAFYNATVSAFFETFGSGDLDAAQFYANHCDADVLRKLANTRIAKPGDGRDARCDFGTSDSRDASCAGGMFRWRRRDGGEGPVDAAPEGYFSPEFQTCLVRCATGAFCPRSARSSAGRETGDSTSLQRGCPRSDSREERHPGFAFAPRDDRSSKKEPNRVETDRDARS